jgi:hypothetical protein
MTKLGLEFVIQNHKFVDVNILFESSYVVLPLRGAYEPQCACVVASLGSVAVRSGRVTQTMVESKRRGAGALGAAGGVDALKRLQENLLDQAYDKFSVKVGQLFCYVFLGNFPDLIYLKKYNGTSLSSYYIRFDKLFFYWWTHGSDAGLPSDDQRLSLPFPIYSFSLCLQVEHMEVMLALPSEDWRSDLSFPIYSFPLCLQVEHMEVMLALPSEDWCLNLSVPV